MKYDLDELFPVCKYKKADRKVCAYDVKVTLNGAGRKKGDYAVRFGFTNKAASVVKDWKYIRHSSLISSCSNRIYFRKYDEKETRNVYTVQSNRCKDGEPSGTGFYYSFMPTPEEGKKFRMNWVNKTFDFLYDEENEMYYIEQPGKNALKEE